MSIFKNIKDSLIEQVEKEASTYLKYPLLKTGKLLNGYKQGDFIVVGGRKTSGRGYFVLNNYLINPLIQKQKANKFGDRLDLNIIYFSTKKSKEIAIERMIVNYISNTNRGNKLSIPSLYGYSGMSSTVVTKPRAKAILSSVLNKFDKLEKEGVLDIITSKNSIDSLKDIIYDIIRKFGEFDSTETSFTYNEEYKDQNTIIVIDDASGIIDETGTPALRNLTAIKLASLLRDTAIMLDVLIVLSVPSHDVYNKAALYKGTLSSINPYDTYADRVILLHNPLESEDAKVFDYEMSAFTNKKSGISYFRFAHIISNYLGASGIIIPLFMYPENGYFKELPKAEDDENLDEFYTTVEI